MISLFVRGSPMCSVDSCGRAWVFRGIDLTPASVNRSVVGSRWFQFDSMRLSCASRRSPMGAHALPRASRVSLLGAHMKSMGVHVSPVSSHLSAVGVYGSPVGVDGSPVGAYWPPGAPITLSLGPMVSHGYPVGFPWVFHGRSWASIGLPWAPGGSHGPPSIDLPWAPNRRSLISCSGPWASHGRPWVSMGHPGVNIGLA